MANLHTCPETAQRIAIEASLETIALFCKLLCITTKTDGSSVTIAGRFTKRTFRAALEASFRCRSCSFVTGLPWFGMLLGIVSDDAPQLHAEFLELVRP